MATKQQKQQEVLQYWLENRLLFDVNSVLSMKELFESYTLDVAEEAGLPYNCLPVRPRVFSNAIKKYASTLRNAELINFFYQKGSFVQGWKCARSGEPSSEQIDTSDELLSEQSETSNEPSATSK